MNPYVEMLTSLDIPVDPRDWVAPAPNPDPFAPIRYDDGVAVFTSYQYDTLRPEALGITDYLVVEDRDPVLALNWVDEILLRKRKTHRYCRIARFKIILSQLMGFRGTVPAAVLQLIPQPLLLSTPHPQLWFAVRKILKQHKLSKYYNRIPCILRLRGVAGKHPPGNAQKFARIMAEFAVLNAVFAKIKKQLGRSYFPNLRYMAVRLMTEHRVVVTYPLPKTLTPARLADLNKVYATMQMYACFHEYL